VAPFQVAFPRALIPGLEGLGYWSVTASRFKDSLEKFSPALLPRHPCPREDREKEVDANGYPVSTPKTSPDKLFVVPTSGTVSFPLLSDFAPPCLRQTLEGLRMGRNRERFF